MTLIDTSGNYGDGRSEKLIGHAIAGQRDRVFLVSKVEPDQVTGNGIARACEASLARLGTDHLDLYLLHWPSRDAGLSSIVAAFESLRAAGKIRAWGVSNFKVSDMEALFHVPNGNRCATNQVLYNIDSRSIEYDLLPWCEQRGMPVMAYSPLGGPAPACCMTRRLHVSARHTVARRPRSRWPGPSAAVTLSQFQNPARRCM
jgi:diketogulonate reductase-like aldo/keto reductase